jgi:hypothetical protein
MLPSMVAPPIAEVNAAASVARGGCGASGWCPGKLVHGAGLVSYTGWTVNRKGRLIAVAVDLYQVDAFTDRAFSGNPAAVCVLPEERPAGWMQQVASEMNLSETAFVVPREDGFGLRWFTPAIEVELCGHATLASAHVLWEARWPAPRRGQAAAGAAGSSLTSSPTKDLASPKSIMVLSM